jgi:hypothetical protein
MAATTGIGPVKQALVRALRDNTALKAMVGSDGINEGTNPRDMDFPYLIYNVVYSTREWDGTNVTLVTEVDVWSISDDQVEAHTLDQLVADALEETVLTFDVSSGQTSLLCRRFGDLSSVDLDGAGKKVYQVGGLYRIWSDQARTA